METFLLEFQQLFQKSVGWFLIRTTQQSLEWITIRLLTLFLKVRSFLIIQPPIDSLRESLYSRSVAYTRGYYSSNRLDEKNVNQIVGNPPFIWKQKCYSQNRWIGRGFAIHSGSQELPPPPLKKEGGFSGNRWIKMKKIIRTELCDFLQLSGRSCTLWLGFCL